MYIHKPVFNENFVTIALEWKLCPCCDNPMIIAPKASLKRCEPAWGSGCIDNNTIEAQCSRVNMSIQSYINDKNHQYICENCVETGTTSFICALCGKEHTTDKIKESFGDPTEYLCKICYETVPAKKWEEAMDRLDKKHMYDFD